MDKNELILRIDDLERQLREHYHNGVIGKALSHRDILGDLPTALLATPATIATTGNTDWYVTVPFTGNIESAEFAGVTALAASDTNYITFSITNLGLAGAGSTAILGAINGNTTKATGGSALAGNTRRTLTLSTVPNAVNVVKGDRLLVRAAVTGTLANTVTFPTYLIRFAPSVL